MRTNDFRYIATVIAVLHLAALSFVCGPWHWKYLLVTAVSSALLGTSQALVPRERSIALICATLALGVQQAAFWLWQANLGAPWWPLAQFVSVHFLFALGSRWLRRPSLRHCPSDPACLPQAHDFSPRPNNKAQHETEPAFTYDE